MKLKRTSLVYKKHTFATVCPKVNQDLLLPQTFALYIHIFVTILSTLIPLNFNTSYFIFKIVLLYIHMLARDCNVLRHFNFYY